MRQGQQSRRGRGRGRKVQNPLARNYESNGPDVKIRGTASHIAEKYAALARDALASGDNVSAENYFQHAEHYNRIIMAAQVQLAPGAQPGDGANGAGMTRARRSHQDSASEVEDAGEAGITGRADMADSDADEVARDNRSAPNGAGKRGEKPGANGSGGDEDGSANAPAEDVPPDGAVA